MDDLGLRTIFVESRAALRQLRKARLVVVDGPDRALETVISQHKTYIGRSSVSDLVLHDKRVSSTHCEIEVEEQGFVLRDLGSTNGTFFSGARVREIFLKPDMSFVVGNTTLRFQTLNDIVEIPLSQWDHFGDVIGASLPMREIFAIMEKVAPSDLTVLIEGETGTGKERLARSIHKMSKRSEGAYVVLDCSAIPKDLAESMVFGHEKGAFTGAVSQHKGAFEQADHGTIFLDEVGELELALQPKLLRVLENRELKRVGGDRTIHVDVRVIAATNRDLREMVAQGTFREDLFFRLSVIQAKLPPLRARKDDLILLVDHLLDALRDRRPELAPFSLSSDAMRAINDHDWPGNVRELKNVLERAVSLADTSTIERPDLQLSGSPPRSWGVSPARLRPRTPEPPSDTTYSGGDATRRLDVEVDTEASFKEAKQRIIDRFEAIFLRAVMRRYEGNISKASREVGLTRYHLRELLKKHDLADTFRK